MIPDTERPFFLTSRTHTGNTESGSGGGGGAPRRGQTARSKFMLTREGAMKEVAPLPGPTSTSASTANPFCRDAHRGRWGGRAYIEQCF